MPVFRPAPPSRVSRLLAGGLTLVALLAMAVGNFVVLAPARLAYTLAGPTLDIQADLGGWDLGKRVARADIRAPQAVRLEGGQRLRGTGRWDLCQGVWALRGLGEVWLATPCVDVGVVMDVAGEPRPVVIAPADPEAFLAALAAGTDGRFPAAPPRGEPWTWQAWLLAIGSLALAALLLLVPRRLAYEVSGGALHLRTLLWTRTVPLAGARISRAARIQPTLRILGVGMPGLHLGLYRLEGRTVRLCLTRLHDVVRIAPPEGREVVVSPADVEGFLAALDSR